MNNASKTPNCSRVKAAESPLCPQVPVLYGLILNITMFRIRPIVCTVVYKYVISMLHVLTPDNQNWSLFSFPIPLHPCTFIVSCFQTLLLTKDIELFVLIEVNVFGSSDWEGKPNLNLLVICASSFRSVPYRTIIYELVRRPVICAVFHNSPMVRLCVSAKHCSHAAL